MKGGPKVNREEGTFGKNLYETFAQKEQEKRTAVPPKKNGVNGHISKGYVDVVYGNPP